MQIEHKATLRLHKLWLKGDKGGVRANLSGANLSGADLAGADLRNANLETNLENADLENANLAGADLDYQIQDGLLQQIAKIILENPKSLEMGSWHTCETTHCLAGWACYLNPVAKELEETHGTEIAGLLTLGHKAHAYFFKENEETIEWLKTIKD